MAQRVQIKLIDDLDGADADETVSFGLDGVVYEIDLSRMRPSCAMTSRNGSEMHVGSRVAPRAVHALPV